MSVSRARECFVARMHALIDASQEGALIPQGPISGDRDPSRLMRNGLAVVAYSSFEDFFASRTGEVLDAFDATRVSFDQLPEKLKEAATVGAVRALGFRMNFEPDASTKRAYVQRHTALITTTGTSGYKFSPLSFMPSSSNLSDEDIERCLKALLVEGPWVELEKITSRIGYGVVGLRQRLKQLAAQRHEAAHAAHADISVADLRQFPHDLLAIAAAFDAVFSRAVDEILSRGPLSNSQAKISAIADSLDLSFIDYDGKIYSERSEGKDRARKRYDSLEGAWRGAIGRSASGKSLLVYRDGQQRPLDWRMG
ncbi:HEPN domain-containing protein [Streptomyces sp. NPDC001093]|uniref:HEPN domain-containing protein n=1 Tax=Streptomyces sp. NPDC001093 TaxID=3154376 RepID=UPI003331155F